MLDYLLLIKMVSLIALGALLVIFIGVLSLAIHVNKEWEESIVLRLGKFDRLQKSGLYFTIPIIEKATALDKRVRTMDIPTQEAITKDNISVRVDAVVFYQIEDTKKAIMNVDDYIYAVRQSSQTTLRNVVGEKDLDQILEKREDVAIAIKESVDQASKEWGIDIRKLELQNIELPEDMKRIMARQAEAEREKRGVIIASEGELEAAENLAKASEILEKSIYGYKLRELQTISDVSQDRSNTIIFAPSDSLSSATLSTGVAAKVPVDKRREVDIE
jgi:regulator of protease activity HflC (stomatin/prohibitin superfamily)